MKKSTIFPVMILTAASMGMIPFGAVGSASADVPSEAVKATPKTVESADTAKVSEMPPVALAFRMIPDADLDLLTPETRLEMTIYMQADSIHKTRNVFSGLSWIEEMKPDYMKVHLTDVSNLQIKQLKGGSLRNAELLMTIYTIAGENDTADSTVRFYSLSEAAPDSLVLKPLPSGRFFNIPDPKEFYKVSKGSRTSVKELLAEMPFHTVAYDISAGSDTLTGRLTVCNHLTLEQKKRIEPYVVPELKWNWNGKKFRLVKQ